jgi:hypothetical protein
MAVQLFTPLSYSPNTVHGPSYQNMLSASTNSTCVKFRFCGPKDCCYALYCCNQITCLILLRFLPSRLLQATSSFSHQTCKPKCLVLTCRESTITTFIFSRPRREKPLESTRPFLKGATPNISPFFITCFK